MCKDLASVCPQVFLIGLLCVLPCWVLEGLSVNALAQATACMSAVMGTCVRGGLKLGVVREARYSGGGVGTIVDCGRETGASGDHRSLWLELRG